MIEVFPTAWSPKNTSLYLAREAPPAGAAEIEFEAASVAISLLNLNHKASSRDEEKNRLQLIIEK